ncbi:hypothetical protein P3X46_020613 [Hevea brasiliensis]|uniref:Uncharacterized protein n=1 Tax=Hevea brasiliensis TaxID=3981 RepID=A0ABQ9LMD6_HEVBR|nr:hypothetical protein P3X46_020613 [Hevea brasiliensis]
MELVAKKGLQQYFLQLQHHPLRTKVPPFILSLCVFLIISALFLREISGIHKLQFRRCAFYVEPFLTWLNQLFGFAYLEPFGHFLHIILDKMFEGKKDTKTVAKIAVLERLALSPWSNMLFMIYYCVIVEKYPTMQFTSWTLCFCPVVWWLCQQYVPLQFCDHFPVGVFLNQRAMSMVLTKG